MVYLPSEVEAKMIEYCTQYNITRKDKQGNIVTSLGSGIVAYLKSQLLGDLPRTISDRPTNGLTREEVLDLIAESIISNTPIIGGASLSENRSFNGFANTNEQQLLSPMGISKDEVEHLIQGSEQRVLEATRNLLAELRGDLETVKTTEEQVNIPQIQTSTNSQDKSIADIVKSLETEARSVCTTANDNHLTRDIKRWLERLKDKKFSDIIHAAISDKLSNKDLVTRLFTAGYGKNDNTEPYPPNLGSAMKTALKIQNSGQTEFMTAGS